MDFADKLKEIRRKEGLSQEQLSERIGVSRQAITKWETGKGLPDIDNMIILAEVFKLTLDELVSKEIEDRRASSPQYVSETVYDIDCVKCFEIRLVRAKKINIASSNNEKLYIKLESGIIENLTSLLKVKLDDNGKRLEVDCIKKREISEKIMSHDLCITILLPESYTKQCEIEAAAEEVNMSRLNLERLEYDGDADKVMINKCCGSIEFAGKSDLNISVDQIQGKLEITQIKAITTLNILEKADFRVEVNNKRAKVFWKQDGEECEPLENPSSENILTVNGIKSEVIINVAE